MRKEQNKQFVNEVTKGLSKDFISGMFILNYCWYEDEDKKFIRVNNNPMFKKKVNIDWKIELVDIKVCEAVPLSTNIKEIVIFHTQRKEKRIISQDEIRQLLILSGKVSSFDEREAEEWNVPNVSKAFYIKKAEKCLKYETESKWRVTL